MPELKRIGEINYDKDNESIAIVNLAYKTNDVICDHEGNVVDVNKLDEHLSKTLAPDIEEKIQFFFHHILESQASPSGIMTLKIERRDHRRVTLKDSPLNYDLTSYIDSAIGMYNFKLERQAKEALEAKSKPSEAGIFKPSTQPARTVVAPLPMAKL